MADFTYIERRTLDVLNAIHRDFPQLGRIKVIDLTVGKVFASVGPRGKAKLRYYKFRIKDNRLYYRGKRRALLI